VCRFTDDFAIVIQREFGRFEWNYSGPVSFCETRRIDAFAWFKRNVRRTHMHTHTHTCRSFQYSVRTARIETHPVYNRTRAFLSLETLMHRLSSCSYTMSRRRRQGETIAFVSIQNLSFTSYFSFHVFYYFSITIAQNNRDLSFATTSIFDKNR